MNNYGPRDDDFDYEDINDIARGEGFNIDDDGHWVPIEDDMDNEFLDYDDDVGDIDISDFL